MVNLGLSFITPIASLIANSGLEEILKPTIAAVEKMLIGEKYPINLGCWGWCCELKLHLFLSTMTSPFSSIVYLQSLTSKNWMGCLTKPISIFLLFTRAKREGEYTLHEKSGFLFLQQGTIILPGIALITYTTRTHYQKYW